MQKEFREKLFEFFKEAYFFQFERREKINGRVGILLAIVTVAANIGLKYVEELPKFDGSTLAICFYSMLFVAVGFGAVAVWFLIKSLAQTLTWHYLPTPRQMLTFLDKAAARNKTLPEAERFDAEQAFENNLIRQFAEASTHNDMSNDMKNLHSLRTTQATIATLLALVACAPFFYSLRYKTEKPAQRVEITKPIPKPQ
jgi:hypothetical protein